MSGAWEETKLVGHSVPPHTDNAKRDDAIMISMPPMTVLSPHDHKTELKNSPITNSPRTHRTRAPLLDTLAIFISSHHATLATYSLTLGVRRDSRGRARRGVRRWTRVFAGYRGMGSNLYGERGIRQS